MDLIIAQIIAVFSAGGLVLMILRRWLRRRQAGVTPSAPAAFNVEPTPTPAAPKSESAPAESFSAKAINPPRLNLVAVKSFLAKAAQNTRDFSVNRAWPWLKVAGRKSLAATKSFLNKAANRAKVAYTAGLPKVAHGAKAAQTLTKQGGLSILKFGRLAAKAVKDQWQALYDSLEHIKMRQEEHRARLKERRHFLGDLATKVAEGRDEQKKPAIKSAPQPAAPQPKPQPIAPLTPSRPEPPATPSPAPGEIENLARMERILREQERILIQEIVKKPKDIALYKRLGFVYVELGEVADARECFEQAVRLGSQDPLIRHELKKLATS